MRHCPFCGEEIEIGLDTCPKCGVDLTKPAKPSASSLPKPFHPFAVMAYLVLLSVLIVFLPLWLRPGGLSSQDSVIAQPGSEAPGEDVARPDNINEADRKYMEIFSFEQEAKPLFDYMTDIDSRFNGPGANPGAPELQSALQRLEEFSKQAQGIVSPSGLGACQGSVRQGVEEAKKAVNTLLHYQSTRDSQSKNSAASSFKSARDQRLICESLIELVNKDIEPKLSHSKSALEKEAPEWRRMHMSGPGQSVASPSGSPPAGPAPAPASAPELPSPAISPAPQTPGPHNVVPEAEPTESETNEEIPEPGSTEAPAEGEGAEP